jgi:hypothetical protein
MARRIGVLVVLALCVVAIGAERIAVPVFFENLGKTVDLVVNDGDDVLQVATAFCHAVSVAAR